MTDNSPVSLVTGAAKRLGAATVRALHKRGHRVIIHYHNNESKARTLQEELNEERAGSAVALGADLSELAGVRHLAEQALEQWGRIDNLINNASVFYARPLSESTSKDWDQIMNTNVRAPFFLAKRVLSEVRLQHGSIINLIDIHAEHPLADHPLYCASKAALAGLTRAWARDLAPDVRVNGIAPGTTLWPEGENALNEAQKHEVLETVPLHRVGSAEDIAGAITWLVCDAPYVTGQIIAIDGGRSLSV
ncbi:pteridine reductase [Marinobacteraceae bacterium S3BR75-40.1]